jgi:RND family efflux transporter MFP subunit
MGTVRTLRVSLGSHVQRGEVLATLSAGEIDAQANRASAVLAQAEVDLRRIELLGAQGAIAPAELDASRARYEVARAGAQEASVMRGYTVIRAPITGIVTSKPADVGDLAIPGQPLLVLENPSAMRLEASVPETLAHDIAVGGAVRVRIDAIDRELDATVAELSPSADAESRTVLVKLDLPPLPELRSGMFGRVWIARGHRRSLLVPERAVLQRGQIETVFVARGRNARMRIVRVGRVQRGEAEILSGLSPGEAVVVTHVTQLVDGQPLEVTR